MERPEAADWHEPSISDRCRRGALALVAVFGLLFAGGTAAARTAHPAPRKPRVTVAIVLARLLHSGAIDQSAYASYQAGAAEAGGSLRRLSGTRRAELAAVLGNLEAMASAGQLTASRLPEAFLTLKRNREWWTAKPLPAAGARVSLPGSRLVWEHYAGQGIEIQWLATFGEANGYYGSRDVGALEQVLDEAIALATRRAGGIAWDYMFRFDGGAPPWTSALSQGTALQALARAASVTGQTRYLSAAQQALGIFRTPPPEGVLAKSAPGDWYLQYSYAPTEHIVNGFVQSLVGLYDYSKLSGDPLGQQLFEAGDAQAREQVPRFDTGAWSKYDQSTESDLGYHNLLTEFLEHLCERTRAGEPLAGASTQTGGSGLPASAGQISGDAIYCTTASRFRGDLKTPPVVALLTRTVNANERAGVQVKLSKVSTVSMTITLGGKTVWANRVTVEGTSPRLLWVTPSKPGSYDVALSAVDLAGNRATATGSIAVKPAPRHPAKHGKGSARTAATGRSAARAVAPAAPFHATAITA